MMEPEVLTAIKDGKHIPLGIGFFHGKHGHGQDDKNFEVYTPKGIKWNGNPTPENLWLLAKMHALCADSQTHQIVKHLGMGHMLCETFAVAHHNTYYYKPWCRKDQTGN